MMLLALLTGCQTGTGRASEGVGDAGKTRQSGAVPVPYSGPRYRIAIGALASKATSKVPGIAEAAKAILQEYLQAAGLEPVDPVEETKPQPANAALPGGPEPADYRIQGAVTGYSQFEKEEALPMLYRRFRVVRALVEYSLVEVESGRSVLAESEAGEYRKEIGESTETSSEPAVDEEARDGALRAVFAKAMENVIRRLSAQPFRGRVLAVEGQTVLIRAGERSRLAPGAKLGVYRVAPDLRDPESGQPLGKRERQVGEIVLTRHRDGQISEATVKAGTGFQIGDIVRALK